MNSHKFEGLATYDVRANPDYAHAVKALAAEGADFARAFTTSRRAGGATATPRTPTSAGRTRRDAASPRYEQLADVAADGSVAAEHHGGGGAIPSPHFE